MCSDETLGEDEVVEGLGVDVGDAVCVALDAHWSGEAREPERSVELRKGGGEGVLDPATRGEEAGDSEDDEDRAEDSDEFEKTTRTPARRLDISGARIPGEKGRLGSWFGEAHRV